MVYAEAQFSRLAGPRQAGNAGVLSRVRRNDPDRLVLREYDPIARQHVDFREER